MTDEIDFSRLKRIVVDALALPPDDRDAYLRDVCGADTDLLAEARSLIATDQTRDEGMTRVLRDHLVEAAREASAEDEPPEFIGPYRVLSQIGEGGMGLVYLAQQREPIKRRVAVKILKIGMDTREVLARFDQEQRALSLMSHPNIAQVLDSGMTAEGRPYFMMEYVPGIPISDFCDENRLSTRARIELFDPVCRAVQHAHQKGVIHRDLKPSNILVMLQDGQPVPKIIDFGIAKAVAQSLTEETLFTRIGQFVGTLEYMSPEQANLTELDIDTRSDIFSLGVVLYELLVGALPFDSSTLRRAGYAEIQRIIREVDPTKPSTRIGLTDASVEAVARNRRTNSRSLARQVRGDLDWIVMKMLAKDRADRYASAQEVADDLVRHLNDEAVIAGPPSPWYRLSRTVKRHKALVGATSAIAVSVVAGLAAVGIIQTRANERLAAQNLELNALTNDVLSLSAMQTLNELKGRAATLWPATPDRIDAYEEWLSDAHALMAELDNHEAKLSVLQNRATRSADGVLQYANREDRWWANQLERLVEDLRAFGDPLTGYLSGVSPIDRGGVGRGIQTRLELARSVRDRSLESDEAADLWERAILDIRDFNPRYEGLQIAPQLGLLPLGRDPESGLWEFVHVQTGEAPTRDASGRLELTEETGLVFVLLPGGSFLMGAQNTDPNAANYDPMAQVHESPVHTVELAPYFMSKFELTQGQWLRLSGSDPSLYKSDRSFGDKQHSTLNPVERISWEESSEALGHLGLQHPTEAQWEFAARAGTRTRWWSGSEKETLQGVANLVDSFLKNNGGPATWEYEEWLDDGWAVHAPVGTFAANPYGLHEMQGNVWEWCDDLFDEEAYELPPREGDGAHMVAESDQRTVRGGSFDANYFVTRSAHRGYHASGKLEYVGVRPARRLDVW